MFVSGASFCVDTVPEPSTIHFSGEGLLQPHLDCARACASAAASAVVLTMVNLAKIRPSQISMSCIESWRRRIVKCCVLAFKEVWISCHTKFEVA